MRTWIVVAGAAGTVGSVVGAAMVCIAIQHNPQEEFVSHMTGAINYGGLSAIFLSRLVVVGLAVGFVVWVLSD
jgi:hypothetical protein